MSIHRIEVDQICENQSLIAGIHILHCPIDSVGISIRVYGRCDPLSIKDIGYFSYGANLLARRGNQVENISP